MDQEIPEQEPVDLEVEEIVEEPEEVPTAPELPEEPATDEVTEEQEEKPVKKAVPKVNTKEEEVPVVYTQEDVPPPDRDKTALDIEVEQSRQLTPEQAIAFANTQPNPIVAIDALRKARRLLDVTDTYQLAEDTGLRG